MENTVLVAVISFAGTLIGTAGGIITSEKLMQYRLEQLEKKVDLLVGSTSEIPVIKEKISGMRSRICSLEKQQNLSLGYFDGN